MISVLYYLARATIAKQHRWGGLNNRNLFPHSSGGYKPEIKVSVELVPSESSKGRVCSRSLHLAIFSPCLQIVFSVVL